MRTERLLRMSTALVFVLLAGVMSSARGQDEPSGQANDDPAVLASGAADVINRLMGEPQGQQIPVAIRQQAKCIAVFPTVTKAAMIIGGKRGDGLVSCRRYEDGEWGAPVRVKLTGVGLGIQAGIQSSSYVLIFLNNRAVDRFVMGGGISFGGGAAVAAGPLGTMGETGPPPAIVSYTRTEGVFVGVEVEGARISFAEKENADLYGWDPYERTILFEKQSVPESVAKFPRALMQFAPGMTG